jgi:undecaprenyl-diphosphatase
MPIITSLGNTGIFWILLAVVFLCFRKTRKIGITMGIALIFGLIFGNLLLKPLTARIRPYDFDPSIVLLIPPEHEFSFPSGHTLASFEGAVSVFLYRKKWGIPALILAALIAFSRLYLMVHYPIDIIVGLILGSLFAWTAYKITAWISVKTNGKLG